MSKQRYNGPANRHARRGAGGPIHATAPKPEVTFRGAYTVAKRTKRRRHFILVGTQSSLLDPTVAVAEGLNEALDPRTAPSKVKTWADMTPEEREEMLRLYKKP